MLHNEIVSFLSRGVKLILIDFQDVVDLDRVSAVALQATLRYVHNHGSKFYICSLKEQVKTTFKVTQIEHLFNPLKNRQEFEEKILAPNLE